MKVMGDCGIAPEESWTESDWKFFGDDSPSFKPVTYEKIFSAVSITKTVTINRGSDGKFYLYGTKYNSFLEALNRSDAFVLHTTYIRPVFIHLDVIELVAEEINKVLKSAIILEDDRKWRAEWEVLLNRKSHFDFKKRQIYFILPTSKPKCILPKHLGEEHEDLRKQLEEYLSFLFDGLYPYHLLELSREEHPEILRQHHIFSSLQLQYAHLLIAWTDRRGKIEHSNYAFSDFNWIKKIEIEEQNEYFKGRNIEDTAEEFYLDDSKLGKGVLWDRLGPLFNQTLIAYEEYIMMKANGIKESEAMYYSGIHNDRHKSLAEILIKYYGKNNE